MSFLQTGDSHLLYDLNRSSKEVPRQIRRQCAKLVRGRRGAAVVSRSRQSSSSTPPPPPAAATTTRRRAAPAAAPASVHSLQATLGALASALATQQRTAQANHTALQDVVAALQVGLGALHTAAAANHSALVSDVQAAAAAVTEQLQQANASHVEVCHRSFLVKSPEPATGTVTTMRTPLAPCPAPGPGGIGKRLEHPLGGRAAGAQRLHRRETGLFGRCVRVLLAHPSPTFNPPPLRLSTRLSSSFLSAPPPCSSVLQTRRWWRRWRHSSTRPWWS